MMNRSSTLITMSAAAFLLACGGNPAPDTPEPAAAEPAEAQPPAAAPAGEAAGAAELTDERAMELARGYVQLLHAGNYQQLWANVTPQAQERFGTLENFQTAGERIMTNLGAETGVVSETIEPARAGMLAQKLYLRVSNYAGAGGTPVQVVVGLMPDGSIAGLQVREAE